MDWGSPLFVIAIIALSTGGWVINTWIRAKHGYPLDDESGGTIEPINNAASHQLKLENNRLSERMELMENRVIVLEKIVTDKSVDVAHQIEALRDPALPEKKL